MRSKPFICLQKDQVLCSKAQSCTRFLDGIVALQEQSQFMLELKALISVVQLNVDGDSVELTCSEVKRTSLGAAAMPLVLTSGKNLYLAIITLYMLEIAPPVE